MIKLSSRSSSCLFLIKICCFFAFFQSTLMSLSSADEVLKQKFLREYITESEFIEAKLSKVRGKFHVERAEKKQEADFVFQIDHGFEKVSSVTKGVTKGFSYVTEKVDCFGNGTYYQLQRKQGTKIYQIKSIGSSNIDESMYVNYTGRILMAPLGARPIFLSKMMKRQDFELLTVEPNGPKGEYLRIHFKYGSDEPKAESLVVLDPNNHWAVISQENHSYFENGKSNISRLIVDYGELLDGLRLPKSLKIERNGLMGPNVIFTEWQFQGTPVNEFNLKYYGLPDIVSPPNNSFTLFYLLVALLILLSLLCIRYYYRYRLSPNQIDVS